MAIRIEDIGLSKRVGEKPRAGRDIAPRAGRPRKGEEGKTLKARKPWLECDPPISEATWYRRRREDRE